MKLKAILQKNTLKNISTKRVLFIILLAALLCPIWHNFIFIFDFEKFEGRLKKNQIKKLTVMNWFSTEYQESTEKFATLNNPISPFFIRLSNQIDYSFFGKLRVNEAIIGKNMYLYDKKYIDAHYGLDYVGEHKLRAYVEKMKFIQDTLTKMNKLFLYVQSPGKVCYFPEFVPDSLQRTITDQTNYHQLSKLLIEYKINHIDFREYILKLKSTTPYPLFTQTGIHWSKYATVLVMDSINNFIESSMKIDLPEIYSEGIDMDYAKYDDADLEKAMNLLFVISKTKYAYPRVKFESAKNKNTPMLTVVGDSYLGNIWQGQFFKFFDLNSQFWYYNVSVYGEKIGEKIHKLQIDEDAMIKKSDIIIVGCTETNIKDESWKFIDQMYDRYKNGIKAVDRPDNVEYMKTVYAFKETLNENEIEESKKYMHVQHVSLDSAKTIFSIWKVNRTDQINE